MPEGLKALECKRNQGCNRPPIPNIPEKDVVQEALETGTQLLKLTLPHIQKMKFIMLSHGTPENFLMHVQQALSTIWQEGLYNLYESTKVIMQKSCGNLLEAVKAL